jgi:release factor glutamine methyltransferase
LTVRQALAQAGIAPIDAQVLLAHVLGVERAWLAAHAPDPLPTAASGGFFALARRRRDGEPVAYLVGAREFWGLAFAVDSSVLIPRPETETLVECALQRLPRDRPVRLLDLGTGSGAIALALAHERPDAEIVATDRFPEALALAQANAARMKLANVHWLQSDWYRQLVDRDGRFDLIASNPPYIAAGDPHLREGDVRFEPQSALIAGADGLDALRVIVDGARERLVPGGSLVVEHGYDQADAVRELLRATGFTALESRRDLAGIRRVAAGTA